MDAELRNKLTEWAVTYNDPQYFIEDPIAFPRRFAGLYRRGEASLQDVEIAGIFSSFLAWGRRALIVRDCGRLFDQMDWRPYDYVMRGSYRGDSTALHRTVSWAEISRICCNLRDIYAEVPTLEGFSVTELRARVFGRKEDKTAANKKLNMMRRWFVRNDGLVDLGIWRDSDPAELLIPLDVHVSEMALELGLTRRWQKDIKTVEEITAVFRDVFPGDPCRGDFSLFGYGITHGGDRKC